MGDNRAFRGHQTSDNSTRPPRVPRLPGPVRLGASPRGGSGRFVALRPSPLCLPSSCRAWEPRGGGGRRRRWAGESAPARPRLQTVRAGPVPLLREEERSPFLHVRLAGGGEAAVSFSESHLQPAPLSPSGSRSSILSLSHHAGQSRMPCPSPHQTSPLLIATAGAWPGPPRPLRLVGVKSTLIA